MRGKTEYLMGEEKQKVQASFLTVLVKKENNLKRQAAKGMLNSYLSAVYNPILTHYEKANSHLFRAC